MFLSALASLAIQNLAPVRAAAAVPAPVTTAPAVPDVPFYSQFANISSKSWQGRGCGITDLAMIVSYYNRAPVSVDALLQEGIVAGAYSPAGWTYAGLIKVGRMHGLDGTWYDAGKSTNADALAQVQNSLKNGPVIVSVHYKFDPKSTIPHLVVINAIADGVVYYNDPASTGAKKQISVAGFMAGWKKRYIVLRPTGKVEV